MLRSADVSAKMSTIKHNFGGVDSILNQKSLAKNKWQITKNCHVEHIYLLPSVSDGCKVDRPID